MKTTKLAAASLAAVLTLCAPVAQAQDGQAAGDAPPPTLPKTTQNAQWQPLADRGITLSLSYTGEAAVNLDGGLRRDAAYAGQVYVGADLDMAKIAGVDGATIHAAVTNRHGENLAAIALGNNTSVQEIYGTQNTHLAILTWEQKLGPLTVEAGRSQANVHFLNSPLYCNFQSNSACGNPTFVFKNSNFTYFPASSWMAHAKLDLTPEVFAHAGVYEVNPDRKRPNDRGFNFSTRNATGVIVPWEIGTAPSSPPTGCRATTSWAAGSIAATTAIPCATIAAALPSFPADRRPRARDARAFTCASIRCSRAPIPRASVACRCSAWR